MRAVWRVLPRTALSFDAGKALTRTVLRPERASRLIEVSLAGAVPMRLDLGTFVGNDLYCLDDHYESVTLRLWRELALGARTILDVGSHVGTFGLLAAHANPQARVLCIEADEHLARRLREHARPYPNIIPIRAAIAPRAAELWYCPVGGNDGGGFLARERPADRAAYQVAARTLSEVCGECGMGGIDVLKLDVEGMEHDLLVEDEVFFREHAPVHVIVELRSEREGARRLEPIVQAMSRRGYRARRVQGLYAFPYFKPYDLANWHFWRA